MSRGHQVEHERAATPEVEDEEPLHDPAQATQRSLALLDRELERGADLEAGKPGEGVFQSSRFVGDAVLAEVAAGTRTLGKGERGVHVSRIQAGLKDAGHAPASGIDGAFEDETEAAVRAFQAAASVTESGEVDQATLKALDGTFADHTRDAAIAQGMSPSKLPREGREHRYGRAPKELLADTDKLNRYEKKAIDAALSPIAEVDATTGKAPVFQEDVNGQNYGARLREVVELEILEQYQHLALGKQAIHDDPANLHDMKDVEAVARQAKESTDVVFGAYATGKAFTAGKNIRDRWATQQKEIEGLQAKSARGGRAGRAADADLKWIAQWRVQKIFNEDWSVEVTHGEHGALPNRAAEKAIIDTVIEEMATRFHDELLEIHKGWGGSADPDNRIVYLQLFKSANDDENRLWMWEQFQTMIHEYIHTLAHSRFRSYADGVADDAKSHALREGMTDYLTKVVWASVNTGDPALRKAVEGPFHDPAASDVPPLETYDAASEAEEVVGIAGARNAFAAYFLGHTELIGG